MKLLNAIKDILSTYPRELPDDTDVTTTPYEEDLAMQELSKPARSLLQWTDRPKSDEHLPQSHSN